MATFNAIGHLQCLSNVYQKLSNVYQVNLTVCPFVCFAKAYGGGRGRRDNRHKDNMIARLFIRQTVSRVTLMENENDTNDPDRYDAQGYLDPDNGCYDADGNFIGRPPNW